VIRRLAGILPSFTFSSHATLYLQGRLSPDDLLGHTPVRTVDVDGEPESLLIWLARIRKLGVDHLRPLPIVPGDWQGLTPVRPDFIAGHEAVVVSEQGHLLVVDDHLARLDSHQGCEPPGLIFDLMARLLAQIAEVTAQAEAVGGVLPLSPSSDSALELPSGFTAAARRLTRTASTILVLDDVLSTSSIDLSSHGQELRRGIREGARLSRMSLSAVITPRTIE
jgi:hypothetical protein